MVRRLGVVLAGACGRAETKALGPVVRDRAGDTLLTYEYGNTRLSLFTPNGTFLKALRLEYPGPTHPARPVALLGGGVMLARSGTIAMPGMKSGVGIPRGSTRGMPSAEKPG